MNWYLEALKKYAQFHGRARRKEYWFFMLFNILISIGFYIVDGLLGLLFADVGALSTLYTFAILLPLMAVTVRRLHDTNRSGWWILIDLLPLLGPIVMLIFMVLDSTPGTNNHGPCPKEEG
ncbi:MAG: DUF805 domain-containing protein [Vampirovibrionales bacterium]|nr:DUF805 domain-containing protein [Vampirovibrionales bacterium]